jgi:hypothetical protein
MVSKGVAHRYLIYEACLPDSAFSAAAIVGWYPGSQGGQPFHPAFRRP